MHKLAGLAFGLALAASGFSQAAARQAAIESSMINRIGVQNDFWFEDGDYPRVIELLRYIYEAEPKDYEIATNLGWMLENVQQYDQALAIYVRYRKENPSDPDATFPEAQFYFLRKAYSKVPLLLETSIKAKPHPNSYRVLAHSYDKMGMLKDSQRVWNVLVKDHPEDPAAKVNLKKVEDKLAKGGANKSRK